MSLGKLESQKVGKSESWRAAKLSRAHVGLISLGMGRVWVLLGCLALALPGAQSLRFTSRRQWLSQVAESTCQRTAAAAVAWAIVLGGPGVPVEPAWAAISGVQRSDEVQVEVPEAFSFEESPKPLKTHEREFGPFVSKRTKGFKYGVTVDPVKIDDIRKFGSPGEVLDKVTGVELKKDGTLDVTPLSSAEVQFAPKDGGLGPAYELEYIVDSTRGLNHFWSSVTIQRGKLYVLTVQAKEATYSEVSEAAKSILQSFRVGL
uniref:PsbP C-terminal domain-containing protein n=1 Tax=Pinguiococcus pyrenoidosus TaxID=172671 RepID=A0A7R9UFF4_9STRA|mmetsp:Transcript_8810/g.33247  ORF Transcript_8810/g.33247 Transcript_8810/m.33247 type:complete len:261 (+) Transcript_8810:59-841(+)